ncbi:MAG: redoxin domain-containing protein [Planctomycetes bacterium]|nr:redoxin domain-containing protein [Planctomycetota bacterium]
MPISKLSLISLLAFPLFAQEPATETPVATDAASAKQKEEPKTLQLGQRVNGELTLVDIDGKPQNAHKLMGKITVVNFYSIQCPIQRAWDGRLAAIQGDFEKDGVVFLHIDSNHTEIGKEPQQTEGDAKPYANVREHLTKQKLPFRVLLDHGNKVADLFDAQATPHVYVFGKDGKLVYKGLVDDDQKDRRAGERNDYLRDTLAQLLKGEKVEPFETKAVGCSIKRLPKAGAGEGQRQGQGRGRGGRRQREGGGGR